MTFLLDTNVISEWTKDEPAPEVIDWFAAVDEDRVFLSVISLAEIHYGINLMPSGRRRERLVGWVDAELTARFEGRIITVDEAIATAWGHIMARVQQSGATIGAMDAFFAATAASHNLTLVTRNVRDFAQTDIPILNPWDL